MLQRMHTHVNIPNTHKAYFQNTNTHTRAQRKASARQSAASETTEAAQAPLGDAHEDSNATAATDAATASTQDVAGDVPAPPSVDEVEVIRQVRVAALCVW
jgi:hypothetical protein